MLKRAYLPIIIMIGVMTLNGCFPIIATGVGAGVLLADDRRSNGAMLDDESIEIKVNKAINNKYADNVHVNVTSYNRYVLLTGEAPTQTQKDGIEQALKSVPNIRGIYNEIVHGNPSTLGARSNDAYITSKVKARLLDQSKVQTNHVKVVTEGNIVYLLGLVKKSEAQAATDVASTTGGVRKVVKLFEYTD